MLIWQISLANFTLPRMTPFKICQAFFQQSDAFAGLLDYHYDDEYNCHSI